jgi:type IV pilus assembly protein PilY1
MKTLRSVLFPVLMTLGLGANIAYGEDIDLYTGDTSGGDVNVLFVFDNESNGGANMGGTIPTDMDSVAGCSDSTYYCAQKYALIKLLQRVKSDGTHFIGDSVGVGIMMYGSGSNKGSYVRFSVRKMNDNNRAVLIKVLKSVNVVRDDRGSSQQDFGMVMWEAFKYFGGGSNTNTPQSETAWGKIPLNGIGTGTDTRDYAGNTTNQGSADWAASALGITLTGSYALTSQSQSINGANGVRYIPPTHTTECGKNYIIYIGHSDSQGNTNNVDAQLYFKNVGGSATQVSPGAPTSGDEGSRYMFNSDVDPNTAGTQNVITYTIGTYGAPCTGQVCSMITSMKSMANVGGGSYYDATDIQKLYDAIGDILTNIQGTPSVFASATLPVSVNTQGLFLNQVFIGMFRPDESNSPKWLGNLKQYKLKYDVNTNSLRLADANNADAVDASSGFITTTAQSFWTTSSSFWTNWMPTKTSSASDSPDGPEVQKGGAAQRQREVNLTTQTARNVYTCAVTTAGAANCSTSSLSLTPFNTTTLVPTAAGTQTAFNYPAAWVATTSASTDITNLIDWVRGTDNLNNELGPGGTTTIRPTIHGDVLHSHPVALDFAGRVVVFYGSNEGMVRAVEAKQTGTGAGNELWSFVAPELLGKLNRLRQQSPIVILPSSTTDTTFNKSYFMDGAIGAYQTTTSAIIYVAARRGGNFIYAIDVTNPDNPKIKFTLSQSTTGMSTLGQTWSLPKVARIRDGSTAGRIVLVFGGGYNTAEDSNTHGTAGAGDGRGVYVVDAVTGVVIHKFLTAVSGTDIISTSIPSDVTIVDTDRDGFIDRAYVGDLDGNVWRMELDDGSSTNPETGWKLYKLASLGARKFFFPPDVVITAGFDAVLVGSGDREKPLSITSSDRFYMIKDAKTGFDGSGQTTIVQADLVLNTADSSTAKGWYYNLNTAGEKVVNAPLTVGGVVYFGTNRPTPAAACTSNLGEARSYAVSFLTGAGARSPGGAGTGDDAYSEVLAPRTGLPPSPVAGLVDIDGNGTIVPFCIGCGDRRSALEASVPDIDPAPFRRKTYWKFKNDK